MPEPVALAIGRGASSPSDGTGAKGALSVPMLQLRAAASNGAAMLQTPTLKASGSGRDDLDLTTVKLVLDSNGNGVFDAGETVLTEGRPGADDGEVQLTLGSAMAVTTTADLLVVADVAGEVHSASAAAALGSGLVLALGVAAWPAGRMRRLPLAIVAAAMLLAAVAGCGGGGGDDDADEPVIVKPADMPPPAPPVLLTYRLDLVAVAASDTAAPPKSLAAPVSVEGATLTVRQ